MGQVSVACVPARQRFLEARLLVPLIHEHDGAIVCLVPYAAAKRLVQSPACTDHPDRLRSATQRIMLVTPTILFSASMVATPLKRNGCCHHDEKCTFLLSQHESYTQLLRWCYAGKTIGSVLDA